MPTAKKNIECCVTGISPTAALAGALLTNSFLRSVAVYTARTGAAAAIFSISVLGLVIGCFSLCWQQAANPLLRVLWAVLLFLSSAFEILRIAAFLQNAYPNTITPVLCGVLLLLPVVYLRRNIVLVQVGRILLWMLVAGTLLLVASVLPQLRFEHLQINSLTAAALFPAAYAQLTLSPEYLLPTLWLTPCNKEKESLARYVWLLPVLGVGADVLVHFVLELFFGAATFERSQPLYTAACSGALSVFARLEWLQVLLWCGATTLKLALYFYGTVRLLCKAEERRNTEAVPLSLLCCYGSGLLFFCILLAGNTAFLSSICTGGFWALAALTMIGGAAAWLCRKAKSSY